MFFSFGFFSQSNNNIYITPNILLSVLHSSFLILIFSSYSSFMFFGTEGNEVTHGGGIDPDDL